MPMIDYHGIKEGECMREKFTNFNLKIIALIFMLVDHIYSNFGLFIGLPKWVHFLGRFVAPLFLYFLMEGFKYTKNRKKYLSRLFIFAMLMHVINIARNLITNRYFNPITKQVDLMSLIGGNNIFWTLFLFLALFMALEKVKINKLWFIPVILISLLMPYSEGGIYLYPIALMCYFFNNDPKKVSIGIFAWSIILLLISLNDYYTNAKDYTTLYQHLAYSSEFMMLTSIPFIMAYNGKKGGSGKRWEKNLFYIFYPLHLIIIYVIIDLLKI